MASYLCIQNNGIAPIDALLILGITTSRYNEHELSIGQFGSGAKHAVALMLRMGVNPIIYCGKSKLTFTTEPRTVGDRQYCQPVCEVNEWVGGSGAGTFKRRTEKLGFVLEFGSLEWNNTFMALREFISNALDASLSTCIANGKENQSHKDFCMYVTENPRADGNTTQVYLPISETQATEFLMSAHKYFLHLSTPKRRGKIANCVSSLLHDYTGDDDLAYAKYRDRLTTVLQTNPMNTVPKVYRKGVLVGTPDTQLPSLFNYNFDSSLPIDESRNINTYTARDKAAIKLASGATVQDWVKFFFSYLQGTEKWEHSFNQFSIAQGFNKNPEEDAKRITEAWRTALSTAGHDPESVICYSPVEAERVSSKGLPTIVLPQNNMQLTREILVSVAGRHIRTAYSVMSDAEKAGYTQIEATPTVLKVFEKIRILFVKHGLITKDTESPRVRCFKNQGTSLGVQDKGMYIPALDTILISDMIANNETPELFITMLEECNHAFTKTKDFTRDFQEKLLLLVTRMYYEQEKENEAKASGTKENQASQ